MENKKYCLIIQFQISHDKYAHFEKIIGLFSDRDKALKFLMIEKQLDFSEEFINSSICDSKNNCFYKLFYLDLDEIKRDNYRISGQSFFIFDDPIEREKI